jgi:hypothetical protein
MKLLFHAKTKTYADVLATARARRIWKEDRGNIIEVLEQASRLNFLQATIHARSGEFRGVYSGIPGIEAMSLPIVIHYKNNEPHYPNDLEYLGLITHELAHHLLLEHRIVAPAGPMHDVEAHQHIYLFLLDAWQLAYGSKESEKLLVYEINYATPNGYAPSIRWAQQLGQTGRQKVMEHLIEHRQLPSDANLTIQ